MSAAVSAPLAAPASTSRSRSRPPRGAVGLGHFPEDDVATSSRNLIESLARSLSRPRGRTSPPPAAVAGSAAPAQTREQFIAANGGHPWGALGMGSPATSPSPSRSPRGRQTQTTSTSVPPRREWSVSRREWIHAGSTSPAAAVDVLVSSVGDLLSTTTSSRSTPSSSRSQSPERRGRERAAGLPAHEGDVEPKSSRSRSRSVLAKVRGIMRSSSLSPRGASSVDLPDVEDSELLLEKESAGVQW
ncbi:hypothetical protein B0A53_06480 [Rhodotorula sp. CCFEE 5036]|nr:hypothetical protein B0A53_06480 [Rhodotorula sp. CCFEE 5036]